MEIFDVLFIMILCFAILLSTMLIQGGVLVGGSASGIHYDFNIGTILIVTATFAVYLGYIISRSDKELKVIVRQVYGEDEQKREER
jgi:hypothetical protein